MIRRSVVGLILCALVAGLVTSLPTAMAAPAGSSVCRPGETTVGLGLSWACRSLNGRMQFVATGPSKQGGSPVGGIGSCRKGDHVVMGAVRLTCQRVGSRFMWTGLVRGAVVAKADALVQSRPANLSGTCATSSWIQITGVTVSCAKGKGSGAWTARPKTSAGTTTAVASTSGPTPAGASRAACVNAWWDKEFAGVVQQLKARQDPALTERIWSHCHRSYAKYMSAADRNAVYADFFGQLGQIVADEVQRVSAATGVNPCKAVEAVLRPQYDSRFGLIGWDPGGYLPILYKQWQGGPVIGKIGGNGDECASGRIFVQLRRHYEGRHEGPYFPPLGTPDATWPISEEDKQTSWVKGATCLVWSPTFGNTAPGSAARVIGYNYTNMGVNGNMVVADNEVNKCEFKVAEGMGLPVVWKANASPTDLQAVPPSFAGLWHTMEEGCSWTLEPVGGEGRVSWTPADGPYTSVELRAGDRFASTCQLQQNEWEHMVIAPDGLMPLLTLSPGPRRPTTPATCRYLVTDGGSLRNPPPPGALNSYAGSPVTFDVSVQPGSVGRVLRSVGCGQWELV